MSKDIDANGMQDVEQPKRMAVGQIVIQFDATDNAEAFGLRQAIRTALDKYPDATMTFAISERKGVPPSMRR